MALIVGVCHVFYLLYCRLIHRGGFAVLWNRLIGKAGSHWPFRKTYCFGTVFAGGEGYVSTEELPSVISVTDDGPYLPYSVVEYCLRCLPPNVAVICVGAINPATVAMAGHVPIWFEPNEEDFVTKEKLLREHYESQGVEVR